MGDRPRTSRSSGLRLLLRMLSLVLALLVLCVTGRATAATSAVPMCGERNESVAAPPIFRAYQPGQIVASPCYSNELELGQSSPLAPERIVVQERPERVLGFAALLLGEGCSTLLGIARKLEEPARPGFVESPFRPPRA
jgi:hypothetical protein